MSRLWLIRIRPILACVCAGVVECVLCCGRLLLVIAECLRVVLISPIAWSLPVHSSVAPLSFAKLADRYMCVLMCMALLTPGSLKLSQLIRYILCSSSSSCIRMCSLVCLKREVRLSNDNDIVASCARAGVPCMNCMQTGLATAVHRERRHTVPQ